MSEAATDPLAGRVVSRLRVPILLLGFAGGGLLAARLLGLGVTDATTIAGAVVVGLAALALFVCAVFDRRFHNAVSALNVERRERARDKRAQSVGDRAFHLVSLTLLPGFVAGALLKDVQATALGFAAFNLLLLANLAILTRGRPTDRFVI